VLRRVVFPALALVTVCSSTVPLLARPAGADQLSDAKAKASQIEAEIQSTGQRISALGQRFDQDQAQVTQLDQQITATKAKIATDRQEVAKDRATLQSAAINTYVAEGSAGSVSPLFSSNQHTLAEAQTYSQVAEGDLNVSVADLHTAQSQLNQQQSSLQSQQQQATQAANSAQAAEQAAVQVQGQQQAAEAQAQGQVAQIIAQQQAAAAAAAQQAANQRIAAATAQQQAAQAAAAAGSGSGSAATSTAGENPPPPAPGGGGAAAVAAAQSQLGVPYVWGGETPGVGFDCSGLTAWAWGQAGVGLPHFSGAQMADSTPVPIADLEPGDLLFYGPGGSDHVAMYIGGGEMVEAPYTGAVVWDTAARFGDGFAGAGRP